MSRLVASLAGLGPVIILALAVLTSAISVPIADAAERIGIKQPIPSKSVRAGSPYSLSQADTIWVGYAAGSRSPSNPYGVGVGGVWNFDTETAGTDSSQFWQFFLLSWRCESSVCFPDPLSRPFWYFDHGNEVNNGDTNLWLDRENRGLHAQNRGPAHTAGYLRTGITGYWHVDDMNGISTPISGLGSAWCGLRGPNDFKVTDRITGNPLNGDLARYWGFGGASINGSWPGYGNQIDQILYHDVTLANGNGADVLSFRFRTDMSPLKANENLGGRWYNPDPTVVDPWVQDPVDSLMLWVGLPQENAYDVNKRWLSEVIDFTQPLATQPQKLFAQHGKAPTTAPDTTVTVNLPAWSPGTTVRLAFQVKTNRQYSDETYDLQGFDSAEGAALIDDVVYNGLPIGQFDSPLDIIPRAILPGNGESILQDPSIKWITTGKPPAGYGHIHNIYDLPYDDPCGALGSPDRLCDVIDNTLLLSNHDDPDHAFFRESWVGGESPTIPLHSGSPIQTALTNQGLDLFRLEHQHWSGTMDLDQAVFWNWGARYHGPTFLQGADNLVPGWSDNLVAPFIAFQPDPTCSINSSETDLDGIIPPPSQLDSLKVFVWTQTRCSRFGATVLCGKPEGSYFDNIRAAFTGGEGAAITAQFWNLLADTFPFTDPGDPGGGISPGTAAFDTSTSYIKCGLNNAPTSLQEGVIIGDTLSVISPFISGAGQPTRLDMLFRIKPGPGNYNVTGDIASGLVEKDPSHPFWATYSASPGPFSKGTHVGEPSGWSFTTWNSARMDSADNGNISPLVGRQLGIPSEDDWEGTLHEADPNYATLGISHRICFLVDPTGSANSTNICCSDPQCTGAPFLESWPPSAYPNADTTTIEGTKILPDGYFTPGTHIEYFFRRSDAPAGVVAVSTSPDTNLASSQPAFGHFDGQRFLEVGVFPDLWKAIDNGGDGLACMLVVDAADRRGQEHTILGALDSLGYGKNNGAGRGWWENDPSSTNPDPDDPNNWVFPNQGHKGLAFDWFDIQAAESGEGDRPGCRLALAPPELQDRQCKQGPTPEMLAFYYNTILWMSQDLDTGVLHDGADSGQQSNDVALIQGFLASSSPGNERAVWLDGDGVANDLSTSPDAGQSLTLLNDFFATIFEADSYRDASANFSTPSAALNLIPEFSAPRAYGLNNVCFLFSDVISVNGAVPDGQLAQRYEDSSDGDVSINPGVYGAAVYRPADNVSRYYSTLLTGYQLPHLRGVGFENSTTGFGRITFLDNALSAFNTCFGIGPVIAVGDLPGPSGAQLDFVRGAFPNPSLTGEATVQFSLARPAKVNIRFYNVAGRLVHEARVEGLPGSNTYRWDGQTSTGMRLAPGVYFYRLNSPGLEFQQNNRRLILLGAGRP
jgi:hypothetical protein